MGSTMTGQYIATATLDLIVLAAVLAVAIKTRNWWAWTIFAICLPITIWGLT